MDMNEVISALECAVKEEVPGKTRRMSLPMTQFIVDIERFARATGLPLDCKEFATYTVFVKTAPAPDNGERVVFVAVRGVNWRQAAQSVEKRAIASLQGKMEARRKTGLEPGAVFFTRDYKDGWELFADPQLDGLLGLYRRGYSFEIRGDENRGGVEFHY